MAGSGESENQYSSSALYSIKQNNTNFYIPLEIANNPIYGASISEVLASSVINGDGEVTDGGTLKETSFDNNW